MIVPWPYRTGASCWPGAGYWNWPRSHGTSWASSSSPSRRYLPRSVALAGFGLDSLIEIGASTVVLWELSAVEELRQRRALHLIGAGFVALAVYLAVQSTLVLVLGFHPHHSALGIAWTAVTAGAMFLLALGKARTGAALDSAVLRTEGRVTLIDGVLASAVTFGLVLNAVLGWWWADPAAGYVLVYYGAHEAA